MISLIFIDIVIDDNSPHSYKKQNHFLTYWVVLKIKEIVTIIITITDINVSRNRTKFKKFMSSSSF